MTQFDEWRREATRPRSEGRVCLDGEAQLELARALADLASAHEMAKGLLDGPENAQLLAEKVKEADAKVQAATRTMVFERIPRREWIELEEAHPATEAQRKADERQTVDPTTHQPALAAACCVEPGMTLDDAEWLYDLLPDDEWNTQVLAPILRANKQGEQAPKDVSAIADRLISGLKSITARREESPSPSSEDE